MELIERELEEVMAMINEAEKVNLICEVVLSSMKAIQDNPKLKIHEALLIGMEEWDI